MTNAEFIIEMKYGVTCMVLLMAVLYFAMLMLPYGDTVHTDPLYREARQ